MNTETSDGTSDPGSVQKFGKKLCKKLKKNAASFVMYEADQATVVKYVDGTASIIA